MDGAIIGLGEVLWDVLPEGKKLGGAPANFAYHVGQFGLETKAVSALGKDALGDETIKALESKDLKYLMPRVDYPTGTVQVELDAQGVPTYDIREDVAWDNIPLTPEMISLAQNARAVCWGSLAQRSSGSRNTIQRFINITPNNCLRIFDINLRQNFYTAEIIKESLHLCNVLKINDEELVIIGQLLGCSKLNIKDKCRLILNHYNLNMLILTCGADGSYVFTPSNVSFLETPKVDVADTVGAGDSFTATFCAAISAGKSVTEAHKLAVEVSAYVCTQNGAMPVLPKKFTNLKA